MTVEQGKELYEKYSGLKTDRERLQLFVEHKDDLFIVLDNDNSTGHFKDPEIAEAVDRCFDFDCYFGNAKGVYFLFEQLGIEAQPC